MKKKVIAAGHICLDITPVFPEKTVSAVTDILLPGKLIQMGDARIHTGGAVANTGLAMKLLGADVSLMGKIGKDTFGEIVGSLLSKYDADAGMIRTDQASTSYSVVLAIPSIDRIFLHNPGANDTFCAEDIPEEAWHDTALFHFGYPPLMRSMYVNGGMETVRIMKKAKEMGCATSLDMAAVDSESDAGKADWKEILRNTLPYVDFFVPSAEELCYMLDQERFALWQERAKGGDITEILNVEEDIRPLAEQCMAYGAKILLIKCGAAGMYYRTASEHVLSEVGKRAELDTAGWAGQEGFEASYVPERVLSAAGAGDTSIAAFLTAMLDGYPLKNCLQLAAATGASCVEVYDALSGIKPFPKLQEKISAGWKKNGVQRI